MSMVKYQEKFYFPQGHVWVLMDDDWGVEVVGEDGIDGALVGMGTWDFNTREAWMIWGDMCIEVIEKLKEKFENGKISEEELVNKIYSIDDDFMSEEVQKAMVSV